MYFMFILYVLRDLPVKFLESFGIIFRGIKRTESYARVDVSIVQYLVTIRLLGAGIFLEICDKKNLPALL